MIKDKNVVSISGNFIYVNNDQMTKTVLIESAKTEM